MALNHSPDTFPITLDLTRFQLAQLAVAVEAQVDDIAVKIADRLGDREANMAVALELFRLYHQLQEAIDVVQDVEGDEPEPHPAQFLQRHTVESDTTTDLYDVTQFMDGSWSCTCPSYKFSGGEPCKHIIRLRF